MATISGYLSAELAATCNALGYYDGKKYHLEPHCRETLRDLIRYLKKDGESHEIRRYLGNAKLLKTDLLPIVQCHYKELDLFDVAIRLIVNLTNPALLVYNDVIPADKCEHNQYLELVSHLQFYKEAFNDYRVWSSFTDRLSTLLNKPSEERDDDDQRSIERILILIRNILHVPANTVSDWRPDNDASIHDQVLWALHQSGMIDILLYMSSSDKEVNFYMHLLEIICLMVREQPPALLANTTAQRSEDEKCRDEQELLQIRQTEIQEKLKKQKKYFGTRHSNFGGTFVVKNMKSTSDKDMIYHKRIQEAKYITFDQEKQKARIPKNKQPLRCNSTERRSALSVRLILKQFCIEILHAAYNPLMQHVRECLARGKTQDNDESYYLTALKFFMEFNRFYRFQVKFVSETMAVETFHFVQKCLETWYEIMTTDKKKIKLWSFRMHLALKAYKELLQNLMLMDKNEDSGVRESSKVIKSNIFYVVEYRELLLILANTYKKQNFSKQYLVDLIETIHIFLKLVCDFCKNKKIMVQKKQTKRKSKKNKKKSTPQLTANLEEIWEQNRSEILKTLSTEIDKVVIPFDATLEMDMEQQKFEAIKRINFLLKSGSFDEAIALFRASREVWPENETFGSENINQEEELMCLKEVFLADLGSDKTNLAEELEDESDEEENEVYPEVVEQNFEIMDLLKRFASPKIIHICCQLLSDFETNTNFTNWCIVRMLHRIAWDCKMHVLLFQASLFIKFQKILRANNPKYNELAKLAVFITRKFVQVAQKNQLVFAELLFLKTTKDAYEIEEGYGSSNKEKAKPKGFWEEHEEEELRTLSLEYDTKKPSEPMVDWIMDNMIRKDRSKKTVIKKLKEMFLLVDNKKKRNNKWTEELEQELTKLYNEFKDTEDPLVNISERLSEEKSHRVIVATLLRLGLIQDRKEIVKKRKKNKPKLINDSVPEQDLDTEIEDSSDDDEDEEEKEEEVIENAPKLASSIKNILQAVPENKFLIEGLKWISSCIDECLEDLDDKLDTDVPLLPLLQDSMLSIENVNFQNLLWSLNFQKPFQQQEVYWRIPSGWNMQDFNDRKALINYIAYNYESYLPSCAEEINSLILKITGEVQDVLVDDVKDKELDFDSLISKQCKDTLRRELNLSGSESESSYEKNVHKLKSSRFRKTSISSKSSDESDDEFLEHAEVFSVRKRILSDSSDDDCDPISLSKPIESEVENVFVQNSNDIVQNGACQEENNERINGSKASQESCESQPDTTSFSASRVLSSQSSDSNSQINLGKRDRIVSDDEADNDVQVKRKKRFVIESDDED
ncbi:protein timeless homolog [Cimex lectularius]|uniref:Timeout n=1 Tax=Cimex lectularius TaxID=79782 RepID=A0A8I6RK18_CIMLE|nr:protein timeless homolog [Cimex lectularius]XP_014246468.1 protein timeless homolog [Cimex lectularius]